MSGMKGGLAWAAAAAMLAGCNGSSGMEGPPGPQGLQGLQGERGLQGPQGAGGPQGPDGARGPAGDVGASGPAGPQGVSGPQGAAGPQGPAGLQGFTGLAGPQGPTGATGATGANGATGPAGPKGDQGIRGDQGAMGPPGQLFTPTGTPATIVAGSVATASTDGTRLVTGTMRGCTAFCGVAEGPFVLTDARALDRGNLTWFYTVPSGTGCTATCNAFGAFPPTGVTLDVLVGVTNLIQNTAQLPNHMTGGRYSIPMGLRLCACEVAVFGAGAWSASWAGFVPYQ
jgi:hypothetical protein